MSEESAEIVRRLFAAHARRDMTAIEEMYDPSIEWEDVSGLWGDWGVRRGRDGVREAFASWFKAFEDVTFTAEDLFDAGEHVVVATRLRGRGRGSGLEVDQRITLVWTVNDRRVTHVRGYRDRSDALEALGLPQSPGNVEQYRRAAQAFNEGDLDSLLAVMDPEVEAYPRLAPIEGGYSGHDGVRRWFESLSAAFPDFHSVVVDVRDLGHLTFAELRNRGRGAGSDTPFEQSSWHVAEWRDGKCIRWQVYATRGEALDAVGLSE